MDNKYFTDLEAAEQLKINVNTLNKLRKEARNFGLLGYRQQIDEELLEIFDEVVKEQKRRGVQSPYSEALKDILQFRKIDRIFALDNTDIRAQNLFEQFSNARGIGDKVDNFFEAFVTITDFLTTLGDNESVMVLKNIQDLIVKKNAYEFSNSRIAHMNQVLENYTKATGKKPTNPALDILRMKEEGDKA